jgi:hypothetical protein
VVYNDIGVTVTQGALLDDLDENPLAPGPPFGPPGHAHFTDDVGGGTFASFLEAERTTGDFTAGLWLEVITLDQVWFDDDEGTGATFGCAGADLLPTLQLAEAGSPTAVNLQTLAVNYQGGSPVVIAGGTLLLALVSFWLLRRGQRSSQTS